ncbi:hypothetical protein AR540_24155 [Pseudomonas sp. EpS/L25]|nr:hypothetical protein AR540_24155 [Pseudomonas sp. EpS/L25]
MIDQFRSEAPVELLCSVFDVPRSCYYAHRRKQRSPDVARLALRVRVSELFTQFARRVVGWAFSAKPDADLVIQALDRAYEQRGRPRVHAEHE